jgi:fluoride ion exporter CrcB/FEX
MAGTLVVDTIQSDASGTIIPTIKSTSTTAPTIFQNSAGTEIGTLCRAWVNFNGTTGAIRSDFNVTSVTRNTTGSYTINFTTAMPDVNYSISALIGLTAISGYYATPAIQSYATGSCSITIFYGGIPNAVDPGTVCVSVFK